MIRVMPELPEVETLRASLEPALVGARVLAARVHRRDVVCLPGDPPGGFSRQRRSAREESGNPRPGALKPTRPVRGRDLLAGGVIEAVHRLGKRLEIRARDGRSIAVHLGMTGQLLLAPAGSHPPTDHVHVVWTLDRPGDSEDRWRLLFRDPRRFGGIWVREPTAEADDERLGPDALDIDADVLRAGLTRTRRGIKSTLLDQRTLAGVGNIYADEALFRAGLHPLTRACDLTTTQVDKLASAIREVLREATQAGGSTLRDFRDANGSAGDYRRAHRVYGRSGEPCVSCGMVLTSGRIGQRTTVWCPRCQPEPTEFSTASRSE